MRTLLSVMIVTGLCGLLMQDGLAQTTFDWIAEEIDVYGLEVIRVDGRRLTVRVEELGARRTFRVPSSFKFYIDNVPTDVTELRPRQRLTAYVTRTRSGQVQLIDAGPPRPRPPVTPVKPPVVAAQVPAAAPVAMPKTASPLPLIGLGGLLALGFAFGLRRLRARG